MYQIEIGFYVKQNKLCFNNIINKNRKVQKYIFYAQKYSIGTQIVH